MKSKVSKRGIIFLLVSVFIITIIFTDVGKVFETNSKQVAQCSDSADCSQALKVLLDPNSIVDTDVKLTESNDDFLTRFLDEQDIGFSEKLGIETQVVLLDSDQNVYKSSNVLGIPQLSVTDEQGRLLDLGSIQTSFLAVSKSNEHTMNVWGTVQFYLDDDLISTKRLWLSATNTQKADMFVTNNLSFVGQQVNTDRLSEIINLISGHKAQIQKLEASKQYWIDGNFGNSNDALNNITTQILELNKKIIILEAEKEQINKKLQERVPVAPSFSDRKTNFTFTLSDEGRDWKDNSEHHYRVVLTEINGNLNSDNNFKEFRWNGEYIAYDLKVIVDESKIVVIGTDNSAIQLFKSDGTFIVGNYVHSYNYDSLSSYNYCIDNRPNDPTCSAMPTMALLKEPLSVYLKSTNELLGVVDNSFFNLNQVSSYACGGYPVKRCSTNYSASPFWSNPIITDIPRATDLIIKSPTQTVEFTTPKSQFNLIIECDHSLCTSNFGYSYP